MKKILVNIVQGLQSRFNLRSVGAVEEIGLMDSVQPITNVDELLVERSIANISSSITATGNILIYRVPASTRLTLRGYQFTAITGTWTIDYLLIVNPATTEEQRIEQFTGVAERSSNLDGRVLILEPGWDIYLHCDTKAVNGNVGFYFIKELQRVY